MNVHEGKGQLDKIFMNCLQMNILKLKNKLIVLHCISRHTFKLLSEFCVLKVLQYIIQHCFNVKTSTLDQCLVLNFESMSRLQQNPTLIQCHLSTEMGR